MTPIIFLSHGVAVTAGLTFWTFLLPFMGRQKWTITPAWFFIVTVWEVYALSNNL